MDLAVQKMEPVISEETIELHRRLLSEHYINGGVPADLVAEVESTLRELGQWFPDPHVASWIWIHVISRGRRPDLHHFLMM